MFFVAEVLFAMLESESAALGMMFFRDQCLLILVTLLDNKSTITWSSPASLWQYHFKLY